MKDSVYRSIDRLSYSSLKDLFVSFEYFKYRQEHKTEPTKDMIFGSALHHMVLGTESQVKLLPSGSANSNKYKEELATLRSQADEGDVFISEEEYEILQIMQTRTFNHSIAGPMFRTSEKEVALFFSVNGIDLKAKLDMLDQFFIGDPKTWTPRPGQTIADFIYTIRSFKYHLQAACYVEAAKQNGYPELPFYNIVFVKQKPYPVYVVEMSQKLIQEGRELLYQGTELYKLAESRNFIDEETIIKF